MINFISGAFSHLTASATELARMFCLRTQLCCNRFTPVNFSQSGSQASRHGCRILMTELPGHLLYVVFSLFPNDHSFLMDLDLHFLTRQFWLSVTSWQCQSLVLQTSTALIFPRNCSVVLHTTTYSPSIYLHNAYQFSIYWGLGL